MVIDDDDDVRRSLVTILEEQGYAVVEAADPVAAVNALAAGPDLILLDMMMPNGGGWKVLEALQLRPAMSDIPVVVISAYASSVPTGAKTLLRKPIRNEDLIATISALLSSH
jgi:CheY-like chemotaxis protein